MDVLDGHGDFQPFRQIVACSSLYWILDPLWISKRGALRVVRWKFFVPKGVVGSWGSASWLREIRKSRFFDVLLLDSFGRFEAVHFV